MNIWNNKGNIRQTLHCYSTYILLWLPYTLFYHIIILIMVNSHKTRENIILKLLQFEINY